MGKLPFVEEKESRVREMKEIRKGYWEQVIDVTGKSCKYLSIQNNLTCRRNWILGTLLLD